MATWNSRGLRGSTLEEFINLTNEKYAEHGLALIQKVPTPITPVKIDKGSRHITLAYFEQKSTVDYIGAVQGIPVCFDAKECHGAGIFHFIQRRDPGAISGCNAEGFGPKGHGGLKTRLTKARLSYIIGMFLLW